MGIGTSATLILGLTGKAFKDAPLIEARLDPEDPDAEAEDEGDIFEEFDCASRWYDCDRESCVFGVSIARGRLVKIDLESLAPKIAAARSDFLARTGAEGKLYLAPDIT